MAPNQYIFGLHMSTYFLATSLQEQHGGFGVLHSRKTSPKVDWQTGNGHKNGEIAVLAIPKLRYTFFGHFCLWKKIFWLSSILDVFFGISKPALDVRKLTFTIFQRSWYEFSCSRTAPPVRELNMPVRELATLVRELRTSVRELKISVGETQVLGDNFRIF